MQRYEFDLTISKEQLLKYYRGDAHTVTARLADGRRIQFPANLLTRHVNYDGISGRFALTTDDKHRAVELERVPTQE